MSSRKILFCFRHLEFEPRSQGPLSSYFEVGRERTLGTRLLEFEPSGSAVTPNLTSLGQKQNMFHTENMVDNLYTSGNHRLESAGLDAVKGRYWGGSFFYIGEITSLHGNFSNRSHKFLRQC